MGATNPQIYYEDPLRHGEYKYVSFLDLINNFMDNMTGDDTLIGQITRRKVIYQMKQGIRQFNTSNLREIKGCELELNDTLTAIYPPDYVSYVSISYVDQSTGKLMTMNINPDLNTFPAFLQDNNANILFDHDGYILEGTSMNAELESQQNVITYEFDDNCFNNALGYGNYHRNTNFRIDATKNINGSFNTTNEGFHFSSDAISKVIMLTYVSDGLESNDDKNIKINKLAESALYAYVKWQLLTNKGNVQEYIVKRAEREYIALYRNATIKLMNIRHTDVMFLLNNRRNWLR
jgi:hypothetical protein